MPWLWHRPAVALIRPLGWEPPYAEGVALKSKKKKKKKERKKEKIVIFFTVICDRKPNVV